MKFDLESSLVFGIVCPIGVEKDSFITNLKKVCSENAFDFKHIKLSDFIFLKNPLLFDETNKLKLVDQKIESGNQIRKDSNENAFFSMYAISEIVRYKNENPNKKVFFLLDQLKHPDELKLLKEVYGKNFYLLSINENLPSRIKNLVNNYSITDSEAMRLIEKDHKEDIKDVGQQTRKVFEKSDFFFNSLCTSQEIERIFHLIYGSQVIPPTEEEFCMYLAFSASTKSLDLARQVGAILIDKGSEVISLGCNDVPKFGGGHYHEGKKDQRDYILGEDANTVRLNQLSESISKVVSDKMNLDQDVVTEIIKDSYIKNLLEFGRVVHAEMDAILSAARQGKSTLGSRMYVTTFPCHNCAKHVLSSGIEKVVYLEEYTKSKALDLHRDSMAHVLESNFQASDKLNFVPFTGVSPKKFGELFSIGFLTTGEIERKHGKTGKVAVSNLHKSDLRFAEHKQSIVTREEQVMATYTKLLIGKIFSSQQDYENNRRNYEIRLQKSA